MQCVRQLFTYAWRYLATAHAYAELVKVKQPRRGFFRSCPEGGEASPVGRLDRLRRNVTRTRQAEAASGVAARVGPPVYMGLLLHGASTTTRSARL